MPSYLFIFRSPYGCHGRGRPGCGARFLGEQKPALYLACVEEERKRKTRIRPTWSGKPGSFPRAPLRTAYSVLRRFTRKAVRLGKHDADSGRTKKINSDCLTTRPEMEFLLWKRKARSYIFMGYSAVCSRLPSQNTVLIAQCGQPQIACGERKSNNTAS